MNTDSGGLQLAGTSFPELIVHITFQLCYQQLCFLSIVCWWLEISHRGCTCTTEIGNHYKSGLSSLESQEYLPACH